MQNFDRYFVKRCFNCQEFGHTLTTCTKESCCSRCAENHSTADCTIPINNFDSHNCINCKKANKSHKHAASSFKCISYLDEKTKLEQRDSNLKN